MDRTLSVKEAFRFGWQEWKKHWLLWIGIYIFSWFPAIPALLEYALPEDANLASLLVSSIQSILAVLAHMGLITVGLKAARQQDFTFSDFFSKMYLFPSFLWGQILYGLAVVAGLILLLFPGLIFAVMFSLGPLFIIDQAKTGYGSLVASKSATYGNKWKLFQFFLVAILFNLLGLLLLGVGFLITAPVTLIAWAHIYLKLTEENL